MHSGPHGRSGAALRAAGLIHRRERALEQLGQAVAIMGAGTKLQLARARTDMGRRYVARATACSARRAAASPGSLITCGALRTAARQRPADRRRRQAHGATRSPAATLYRRGAARRAARREGLTNREIAQALLITTATAKAHLNRIFRSSKSPAADNSPMHSPDVRRQSQQDAMRCGDFVKAPVRKE